MGNGAPTVGWIGTGRMGYQLALRLLHGRQRRCRVQPHQGQGRAARRQRREDRRPPRGPRRPRHRLHHGRRGPRPRSGPHRRRRAADRHPGAGHHRRLLHRLPEVSAEARAVAEGAGAEFLAAPVSGNPKVIAAGKLTVAVSGPKEAFDAVEPLLATFGPRRHLLRRGRDRPPGQDRAQRLPRRRHPGADRDHRARGARRREPRRVPAVPQRLGARLGILPVQVARAGQPRLPPVVHHRAAPQGPPARPRRGQGTRRADAAGGRGRHADRAGHRGRLHRR